MKTKTIGFVLIAIGILMIAYTEFNFVTTVKVVDIGPLNINKDKNHFIGWSPIIGLVVLVGGILLTVFTKKRL
jgi:uncharacterized membrane protein YidH (DUF202 family)